MVDAPNISLAAKNLNDELAGFALPDGPAKSLMPDDVQAGKGLGALLKGLAFFIDTRQNVVSDQPSRPLIERLEGADDKDIADIILNLQIPGDKTAETAQLWKALNLRGKNVFDATLETVRTIIRERERERERELNKEDPDKPRRPLTNRDDKREKKKDKGTWFESLHKKPRDKGTGFKPLHQKSGEGKDVSSEYIRRAAQEFGGPNDAAIRESARSDGEYIPQPADKTPYEKQEDQNIRDYEIERSMQEKEAGMYLELAQKLAAVFSKHMGPFLSSPGQAAER